MSFYSRFSRIFTVATYLYIILVFLFLHPMFLHDLIVKHFKLPFAQINTFP